MATLTTIEIARCRDMIGDSHPTTIPTSTGAFDLSDTEIQAEWDRANGHASETNEYKAYYLMLQRRRGIWLNMVDTQTEQGSTLQNQKLRNIERLIREYKALAGVGSFTMQSVGGVFDFGLDQDDPITGEDLDDA
jgi:hypothetical protein